MRDHARISPFFWKRGSGKKLRGNADAIVVALYLSTAPTANMMGVYHLSIAEIVNDTGLPEKRVRAALDAVRAVGYAFFDEDAELAWVPNHAKFDIGDVMKPGDRRRPKLYVELAQVKGHPFEREFRLRYAEPFGLEPPPPLPTPTHPEEGACSARDQDLHPPVQDRPPYPIRSVSDPEPLTTSTASTPSSAGLGLFPSDGSVESKDQANARNAREVYAHWVAQRQAVLPDAMAPMFNDKRRRAVQARLREGFTVEQLKRAVEGMLCTAFNVEKGFTDLELCCRDASHVERFINNAALAEQLAQEAS